MKGFVGQGASLRDLVGRPRNRTLLSFSIARRPPSGGSNACLSPQRTSGPEGCLSRGLGLGPSLPPIPTPIGLLKGRRGASARPSPLRGGEGKHRPGGWGGSGWQGFVENIFPTRLCHPPPKFVATPREKGCETTFYLACLALATRSLRPARFKNRAPPLGRCKEVVLYVAAIFPKPQRCRPRDKNRAANSSRKRVAPTTARPNFASGKAIAFGMKTEHPIATYHEGQEGR